MPEMVDAIERIHEHTAVFTCDDIIDRMLDEVCWPANGGALLDPGAGHGDVLLRALERLDVAPCDVEGLASRLEGWEFHPKAAGIARRRLSAALLARGWTSASADEAARRIMQERDFLLEGLGSRAFLSIVGNPPYIHRTRIPAEYRDQMDGVVPTYARHDMAHAYLDACSRHLLPGGRMSMVTSDGWLLNENASRLRTELGLRLAFDAVERLGTENPFYVPKTRIRNSPPRVRPVLMTARNGVGGRIRMTGVPMQLSSPSMPEDGPSARMELQPYDYDGRTFGEHVHVMVAPWMGAKGIFVVDRDRTDIPDEFLIPCVLTGDVHPTEDRLMPLGKAVIRTDHRRPPPVVMRHLERELPRMAPRGRRTPSWLPPTTFLHKLPLARPGLMIPRIAKRLRPILIPAGAMPVNSNLVITDCDDPVAMAQWLTDPSQQEWIALNAPPLEDGYLSITTKLLRRMPARGIPQG